MDIFRKGFDRVYDLIKPAVFELTEHDAGIAHGMFVRALGGFRALGLSELVLDNAANMVSPGYEISNAAGFVKNGEVNPRDMRLLGFDRAVVGTVTYDENAGNSGKTIWRFPESGSMVNWDGWSNDGAEKIARRLRGYGAHGVPLTVNLGPTPGKSGGDILDDLASSVYAFGDVPYVDRFELDVSCPNIHRGAFDASQLGKMSDVMVNAMRSSGQSLYLKVSPDLDEAGVDEIVGVGEKCGVRGYVVANTTTKHDKRYVSVSPGKGGASGSAVYGSSKRVQGHFADRVGDGVELIACGGIDSSEKALERLGIGKCKEIQLFSGLVFKGMGLLRELRMGR